VICFKFVMRIAKYVCCEKKLHHNQQGQGIVPFRAFLFASSNADCLVNINTSIQESRFDIAQHNTLDTLRSKRYPCRRRDGAILTRLGLHPTFLVDKAVEYRNKSTRHNHALVLAYQRLHLHVFWLLLGTLVSMDFLSETSRAMHTTHPQVVISVCRLAARDRLFSFISVQMTSNKKVKCASNCIYLPESFVAVRRRRRRFQQMC